MTGKKSKLYISVIAEVSNIRDKAFIYFAEISNSDERKEQREEKIFFVVF